MPHLASNIQTVLRELEEELMSPRSRRSPERLEQLLAENFIEVTASGSMVSREKTIRGLLCETQGFTYAISNFRVGAIAHATFLVTYQLVDTLMGHERRSWRSSIWVRQAGESEAFQIAFHQGTTVAGE